MAEGLERHRARNIVLDPVMVASSGDRLLGREAIEVLRSELIPLALVVTPNLPEAAALTGASLARNEQEMEAQAREMLSLGARNVLIKGGHGEGDESVDLLVGQGEVVRLSAKRIATRNTHGTGCTLSSAIAAGLAKGGDVVTACHGGQGLRHRGDRRRRRTQNRPRPRALASFPPVLEHAMNGRAENS